ncbi:MAG: DUF1727 domain-containing protein [Clostridia bacterium]|nr:DUF1727 domain-containing protein [Clostridia bacterium]
MRLLLAIWACKLAIFASRLLGKKGSSMPGQLAFKICPAILTLLSKQVTKEIIVVCGTNGKTTTNNLLASYIRHAGHSLVSNEYGANMLWGVCCAFAEKASIFGKVKAEYACLEVDEASCVKVFRYMEPTMVVITNLFRDQLDRYGEIDMTVDFIRRALAMAPDAKLIVNGDDPLVAQFGEKANRPCYYVAVDEDTGAGVSEAKEGKFCSFCSTELLYEYHHYSQLGKFSCPSCGYKRHTPDFSVTEVSLTNGVNFTLTFGEETTRITSRFKGLYSVYNIALSYAAARLALNKKPDYEKVLSAYKPQVGRMEEFLIGGKTVVLNMAKNPAGFNQALDAVLQDDREKDLLLAVNDLPQDGMDISWLWDVEFERLKQAKVNRLIVTGMRADELMLRMKYAGFAEKQQIKCSDIKKAAEFLVSGETTVCYGLANYSSVFTLQSVIKEMEGREISGK